MDGYGSKPYSGSRNHEGTGMELDLYYGRGGNKPGAPPPSMRSYSASSYSHQLPPGDQFQPAGQTQLPPNFDRRLKKSQTSIGTSRVWCFNDPEFQRKKRVASYRSYSMEGKVKGSWRKSFRWLKGRYNRIVYGWS